MNPLMRILAVTALFVVTISCAYTAVVTVNNVAYNAPQWRAAIYHGGTAQLANWGPCLDEGAGFAPGLGDSAFYATCGYDGSAGNTEIPSTVWLGVDKLSDGTSLELLPLNKISKLQYYTYVSTQPSLQESPDHPPINRFPMQPIQLQIATVKPDMISRRYLMHRPWGLTGSDAGANVGAWQLQDACTESAIWWDGYANVLYTGWTALMSGRGTTLLVPTSTYWAGNSADQRSFLSCEWDGQNGYPAATGIGTAINLEVGARKSTTNIFNQESYGWWRESVGFRGYVDGFTIGANINGTAKEDTYDFEAPLPPPQVVALNNTACYDMITASSQVPKHFRFKIFGIVLADPAPTAEYFWLSDGSGKSPIKVYANATGAVAGQYWSAVGRLYAPWNQTYKELYSSTNDCFQLD